MYWRVYGARAAQENRHVKPIGVPGGVMPLSSRDTNFFSELPLVVSSALHIDEGVLTVYHIDGPLGFLDMLTKLCRERFSVPVGAFYMARQVATFDPDTESMQFLFLSDAYIAAHSISSRTRSGTIWTRQDGIPMHRLSRRSRGAAPQIFSRSAFTAT